MIDILEIFLSRHVDCTIIRARVRIRKWKTNLIRIAKYGLSKMSVFSKSNDTKGLLMSCGVTYLHPKRWHVI